jgi:thiosulfate dehydrogenase (quinone) large subunit
VYAVFGTWADAYDQSTPALLEGIVMTATTQPVQHLHQPTDTTSRRVQAAVALGNVRAIHVFGGLARIALGWVFLWAFLDKTFGLGHATASKDAWIHGGSPTFGFLKFGAVGPFQGVYNSIAGDAWADWLFMLGLLAIGVALILGVFMNIAAASGALLLVLMWAAVLPPASNLFLDDHIIYALTLGLLACLGAGGWLGLGHRWEQTHLVQHAPVLL